MKTKLLYYWGIFGEGIVIVLMYILPLGFTIFAMVGLLCVIKQALE